MRYVDFYCSPLHLCRFHREYK